MTANDIFTLKELDLKGCYEVQPIVRSDERGTFIKTFHYDAFKKLGLVTDFKEEYYSVSKKNVIRGLHFQLPPAAHEKLVYCAEGKVFDVVVDLRRNSATFGKHRAVTLDAATGNMLYIPKGFAHGFLTLSDKAIMMYNVTSVYNPECDTGIRWNSAGIDWQIDKPIISARDRNLMPFSDFSPIAPIDW